VGHPEVNVPSLSPVTVASFVTAFGAFGLIALGLFDTTARWSLAWAAGGGLVVAVIAHFAFGYFLIAPQGSSEVKLRDIVGAAAEVITPIPADSVGEVAFVAQGGRMTYTAKSATGTPIARGTTVVIEKVIGGVAVVRPQS
jgi:membrane protein implicated in regulation of membrane protease activity